ncbi:hypothetical protein JCM3770_006810 [Rhodotorula araucariae]
MTTNVDSIALNQSDLESPVPSIYAGRRSASPTLQTAQLRELGRTDAETQDQLRAQYRIWHDFVQQVLQSQYPPPPLPAAQLQQLQQMLQQQLQPLLQQLLQPIQQQLQLLQPIQQQLQQLQQSQQRILVASQQQNARLFNASSRIEHWRPVPNDDGVMPPGPAGGPLHPIGGAVPPITSFADIIAFLPAVVTAWLQFYNIPPQGSDAANRHALQLFLTAG